ncbi:MAG: NAD(P)/FAD-dependent oxidoreductase [Streptococcaceae bacterium]|jgi:thioredoxin reductase (NADPH)|nr:NAD(P)/FAD-dependent oxidoreductase [Streptococcaceae bacterium]
MKKEIYDITIIGSGPVGLYAAIYAGMRKAKVKIIESLPNIGGQLNALYPEKYIYDLPGFPKIRAKDFIHNLQEQLNLFEATICLNEKVNNFKWKDDEKLFELTSSSATHYSHSIILAAGKGSFAPRILGIENEEKFVGSAIHYHVDNLEKFRNQKIVIAGGGDSAIDWALLLEMVAKEVSIVHRREQFRAHEYSVERLKSSSVNILTPYVIDKLSCSDKFEGIVVKNVKNKELNTLHVDHVLCNYGFVSSISPIDTWGFEFERGKIMVGRHQETNIPGIFAIGDIAGYTGRAELIATGLGEAPLAVNHALTFVRPDRRIPQTHSSSLFKD